MAAATQTLKIIIDAQNKASAAFKQLGTQFETINKQEKNLKKSLENFEPTFRRMAATGAVALGAIGTAFIKFGQEGAQSQAVALGFQRMTESIGADADEIVEALKRASGGTISETDLMLTANKAMALGVANNTEDFTALMEVARNKAQIMGLSVEQAFNDLSTGIGRGSVMILDNLGITTTAAKAQEQYAAQIGKAVDELTEAEQKQALFNIVIEQGQAEIEKMGGVTTTSAEKLQALGAQFADMRSTIGEALLPALEALVQALTPIIEKISEFASENPQLFATLMGVAAALAAVVTVVGLLGLALPAIITGFAVLFSPITLIVVALTALAAAVYIVIKNWDFIKEKAAEVWGAIKETIGGVLESIGTAIGAAFDWYVSYITGIFETIKTVIETAMYFIVGLIALILDAFFPEWQTKLGMMRDAFVEIWNGIKESIGGILDTMKGYLQAFLSKASEVFQGVANIAAGAWDHVRQAFDSAKEGIAGAVDFIQEKVQPMLDMLTKITDAAKKAASAIKDAFNKVVDKGKDVIGGRASGGAVSSGQPYMVGENGAEMFMPSTAGRIVPNSRLAGFGGSSVIVNINGNMFADEDDMAERVGDRIVRLVQDNIRI